MNPVIESSPLGKKTTYAFTYEPRLLYRIPRMHSREDIGLPFVPKGFDHWNAHEVSWLSPKGKPCIAIAALEVPASSPYLIESKSLKLYLNSFSSSRFDSIEVVQQTIEQDLSKSTQGLVRVQLTPVHELVKSPIGTCIDFLDVTIEPYDAVAPQLLQFHPNTDVSETLVSYLLKSNCPCTQQPDWGALIVQYEGCQIDHASLLCYVTSYRNTYEFAEQCVERAFYDILTHCTPRVLTVQALYTRRGGIDMNPVRSTEVDIPVLGIKDPRQ